MPLSVPALRLDRDVDLTDFVHYLRHAGLPHSTTLEGDTQVVWVENEQAAQAAQEAYRVFEQGRLPKVDVRVGANSFRARHLIPLLLSSPLTLTLLLANLICFPVTMEFLETRRPGDWLPLFTLTDFTIMGGQIYFANLAHTIESGQWWRLISPMFLHFGWLHLIFNSLWVWEFGRQIEQKCGALPLLLAVVFSSLAANLLQYYMYGVGLVGGMSGVVFGLLGFALLWDRRLPERRLGIQPGIYIFMLVYLVIGFTGAIDLLGLGTIANGAHLGGLLGGLLIGLIFTQLKSTAAR